MEKSLVLDYVAFVIYIILIIANYRRTKKLAHLDRVFTNLLLVGFFTCFFDICAVNMDRISEGNVVFKYIFHSLYLSMRIISVIVYFLYISYVTDVRHLTFSKRWFRILFFVPFALIQFLIITAPANHYMYYLNEAEEYTRGPLFIMLYLTVVCYAIPCTVLIYKAGKVMGKEKMISLWSMILFMMIAAIIQFLRPNLLVEMIATCLSIVYMLEVVQRPDTRVDFVTGINNDKSYSEDMSLAFYMKKPMKAVGINITNYAAIRSVIGYDRMHALAKRLSEICIDHLASRRIIADIYYRGNGRIRIIIEKKYFDKVDEFATVLSDVLEQEIVVDGMSLSVEPQICIITCPDDFQTLEEFMNFGHVMSHKGYIGRVMKAEEYLSGTNKEVSNNIDKIIENALLHQKFEVYYQPIYDVNKKKYDSAEALLRLIDDEYGFVSPEIFIPAAEKSGAIHRIGNYVMDQVCAFIASEDFEKTGMEYIEVNLSVAQCMQKDLARSVLSVMEHYKIAPSQINLEITETAASYSQDALNENINSLRGRGITFSLDDYGTGYSNMNRIATMPFHIIKLDKSFTNAKSNERMDIILKDTIQMIKDLGLKIVAEGLETTDMVQKYTMLGCDYIQGYYFSKPLPRERFVEFLEANN